MENVSKRDYDYVRANFTLVDTYHFVQTLRVSTYDTYWEKTDGLKPGETWHLEGSYTTGGITEIRFNGLNGH